MTAEEIKAIIDSVLEKHTDQAHVSTTLTKLYTDVATVITESESNKATAEKMKEDNEKLRQANLDLFLKIGQTKDTTGNNNPTGNSNSNNETASFESLFDENGALK